MHSTLISADILNAHLSADNWVIVDCRFSLANTEQGRSEYQAAHIPGAYYAHLDDDLSGDIIAGKTGRHPLPTVERAADVFSAWGIRAGTQVVTYDHGHGGVASRLWWMLNWLGHSSVAVLDGGWAAWAAADFSVSSDIPALTDSALSSTSFNPQPNNSLIASLDEVISLSEQATGGLFDSRAAKRYRGEEEPIDPVAGHIPSAVNVPFPDNLADGKFLPAEELRARFQSLIGDQSVEDAIFYCGSGVTACHNLLSIRHAGLGMAKLYPGSWSEWITDPSRPVSTES